MSAQLASSAGFGTRPRNQHSPDQGVTAEEASTQPSRQVRGGAWRRCRERLPGATSSVFVPLAYGSAWAIWAALLGPTIMDALRDGRTPDNFTATPAVMLGMYAPALAAVVMRLFISKEGLRRALGPCQASV